MESELTAKHAQMRSDPFLFFRGTYYRWTQLWAEICDDLQKAPIVLGVGDLHVESFGTWRDREGRLCWGVDDFDDAYPLPYTNDLVRLAASIRMVTDSEDLTIGFRDGCDAVLEGYLESLKDRRMPIRSSGARKESRTARHRSDQAFSRLLGQIDQEPVRGSPRRADGGAGSLAENSASRCGLQGCSKSGRFRKSRTASVRRNRHA